MGWKRSTRKEKGRGKKAGVETGAQGLGVPGGFSGGVPPWASPEGIPLGNPPRGLRGTAQGHCPEGTPFFLGGGIGRPQMLENVVSGRNLNHSPNKLCLKGSGGVKKLCCGCRASAVVLRAAQSGAPSFLGPLFTIHRCSTPPNT